MHGQPFLSFLRTPAADIVTFPAIAFMSGDVTSALLVFWERSSRSLSADALLYRFAQVHAHRPESQVLENAQRAVCNVNAPNLSIVLVA